MADALIAANLSVPLLDRIFTNTSLGHRLLHRLNLTNLRHIWYLVSPYETAVSSLNQVPNYNVEVSAWWLTLIALELSVLKLTGHDDRFALNDSVTSICAGMLSQVFKFGGRTIAIFAYVFIWNHFRILELPWDSPWTWILCLITQDFMYYLGHRAVHEAGFFWGLHTIHHSSEYYNLSTALRQAAIQDVGLTVYDCLQAFFIPPQIFLVHRYFSEIFQFWLHTSLIGSLGPLGLVFNTPSYHRVHHGRNAYCIDRNYGGVLIVWDKMFHTFEPERVDDPPVYGLITNEHSFDQIWLQFHTLKELLFDKFRMKDQQGRPLFPGIFGWLQAALWPPGYKPGMKVRLFFHWYSLEDTTEGVPPIECPVIKYNPPMCFWLRGYCFGHFLLLLAIFLHFEFDRLSMEWAHYFTMIFFFVLTMQCFGAFFDDRWYASILEMMRCGAVLFHYFHLIMDHIGLGPNRVFMMSLFGFSFLLHFSHQIQKFLENKSRVNPEEEGSKGKKKPEEEESKEKKKPIPTISGAISEEKSTLSQTKSSDFSSKL